MMRLSGDADPFALEILRTLEIRAGHHSLNPFINDRRNHHHIRPVERGIDNSSTAAGQKLNVSGNQ
jgi:hypothetical protein